MAYSQWGTRKALGRRYGVDPALLMESERLQQEYNLAPGREARGMQASQFQQTLAQQEEQRKDAATSGMIGTGANLAMNAGMLYGMKQGWFNPNRTPPTTTPPTTTVPPVSTAPAATPSVPMNGEYPQYEPGPYSTNPATIDTAGTGTGAGAGMTSVGNATGSAVGEGVGIAGGAVSTAAPYYALWRAGAPILRGIMQRGHEDAFGVDPDPANESNLIKKSMSMQNRIAMDQRGLITPAYEEITGNQMPEVIQGATNPAGYILSKVFPGNKGGCIIITACTDPYSPEVRITRAFRDQYLDVDQLRGYYALAEWIVPKIENSDRVKKNVKKWLVDNLVEYGAYRLGSNMARPRWKAIVVSKVFLAVIKAIGMLLPEYVRANGEVY